MKKFACFYYMLVLMFSISTGYGTTHTIVNSGFTFSPDTITISLGDTVVFSLASIHTSIEVSKATWDANGNTQLPGGFALPLGGGTLVLTQLGTHYYVCGPHAFMGMKGKILVASPAAVVSRTWNLSAGWNMVSVPLAASDRRATILFPGASSAAFSFQGSYSQESILTPGTGYWLKFSSDNAVTIHGVSIPLDTISVLFGWNMIGSISAPLPKAAIRTEPSGIITSQIFGFNGSYFSADTIHPGHAYWVKTTQTGKIIFDSALAGSLKPNQAENYLTVGASLTLADAAGNKQTIYLLDDMTQIRGNAAMNELPPLPPAGAFDARFASGHWIEAVGNGAEADLPVQISSATYPVTFTWNTGGLKQRVSLNTGGKIIPLAGSGTITLANSGEPLSVYVAPAGEIPANYAIDQAFPNPFNPATTIRYQLPEESKVSVSVYNLLGQKVTTLIDGIQDAGLKSVVWNAGAMSSGLYFIRMDAGSTAGKSYSAVIKVILQK